MGRPARHDADELLDCAARLVAAGGPAALTMSAVAAAAGAPSGSVYHRFASRADLLAAVWLRTVTRFQTGVFTALEHDDAEQAAVDAARYALGWSRAHPDETRVLLCGPADFRVDEWSPADRERLAAANAAITRALRALARRLGLSGAAGAERLAVAVVDLPLAAIRRHGQLGTPPSRGLETAIASAVRALVTDEVR